MPENNDKRATHEREELTIGHLCDVLSAYEGGTVEIIERPDRVREGDVDAILSRNGRRIAVEHTTIYSYSLRPSLPPKWHKLGPAIRDAVMVDLPGEYVQVWIPVHDLPRQRHWTRVRERISAAIVQHVPSMPFESEASTTVPPYGLDLLIRRMSRYGGPGVCSVHWRAPGHPDEWAIDEIRRAMGDKREKMALRQHQGEPTILLLDAEEVGIPVPFMNAFVAVSHGEPLDAFDEIYLAGTMFRPEVHLYPFKWGAEIMPTPESRQRFHEAEKRVNARFHVDEERTRAEYNALISARLKEHGADDD